MKTAQGYFAAHATKACKCICRAPRPDHIQQSKNKNCQNQIHILLCYPATLVTLENYTPKGKPGDLPRLGSCSTCAHARAAVKQSNTSKADNMRQLEEAGAPTVEEGARREGDLVSLGLQSGHNLVGGSGGRRGGWQAVGRRSAGGWLWFGWIWLVEFSWDPAARHGRAGVGRGVLWGPVGSC